MNAVKQSFLGKLLYLVPALALLLTLTLAAAPETNAFACNKKPAKPKIQIPSASAHLKTQRVNLGWKATDCAVRYQIEVRQDTIWGRPWDANYDLAANRYRTRKLEKGYTYWWHVEACNDHGCKPSKWGSFTVTE